MRHNTRNNYTLTEANTDLDICNEIISQCTPNQLKDLVDMIVDNVNAHKFCDIAEFVIRDGYKINKQFKAIFDKNDIDIEVVHSARQPWPYLGLVIDNNDIDDAYVDVDLDEFIQENSKCIVEMYDGGYSYTNVCLFDMDVNAWQKADGLSDYDFACRIFEKIVEEVYSVQDIMEENGYEEISEMQPNELKDIIIDIAINKYSDRAYLLEDLVTLTPKALKCLRNFCDCVHNVENV